MDRFVLVALQLLPLLIVGGVFISTLRLGARRVSLRPPGSPVPAPARPSAPPGPSSET